MKEAIIKGAMRWALLLAFCAWATVILVVLLGEDNNDNPLTIFQFLVWKIMAFGSAYATYKAGAWCYSRKMFPAIVEAWVKECEKEEDEL